MRVLLRGENVPGPGDPGLLSLAGTLKRQTGRVVVLGFVNYTHPTAT